MAFVKAN